jgi:molecular chaperone DnaK
LAGRLAIDFGTSNTRAAVWDEVTGQARPLFIPDVSLTARHEGPDSDPVDVPYVPSLISYDGKQTWIGKQVKDRGLVDASGTFRWMKRYISNRLEIPRQVDGRPIRVSDAGTDFLVRILAYGAEALDLGDEEVAFTVPVEAFEHYQDWLSRVCDTAGIRRYRLLDEASAAALGYGLHVAPNAPFMVFDFGGGTLDISIVRMEREATGTKRCSVLGKGGAEIGGTDIDQWLYRDLLRRNNKSAEEVRHISGLMLTEVERAKEALTTADRAEITVADPRTGEILFGKYSRSEFEDLLEANGLFEALQCTVNRALSDARERGYQEEHLEAVLLIGGSSLIPSVRRAVRQMFGQRVKTHRPLDAVALGAAAFVAGAAFYDHVQHDYALRYYNREKAEHDYMTIVRAGTPYPSNGSICQVTVKASYDDQEYLGLEIYEIGSKGCLTSGNGPMLDLVFDPSGAARFRKRADPELTGLFWLNEKCPTFIRAEPKARRGDQRFPVQFSIDGNKRLCVEVKDLLTGKILMKDHPLIKLT